MPNSSRYNAEYYLRNKNRILKKRREGITPVLKGNQKPWCTRLAWLVCGLVIFTSTYEGYLFYLKESSVGYAFLKAAVVESALLSLPLLPKVHESLQKCLGAILVAFSGTVMCFNLIQDFSSRIQEKHFLHQQIETHSQRLKMHYNTLQGYEQKDWHSRAFKLNQAILQLEDKRDQLIQQLAGHQALFLDATQTGLQVAYRILLLVIAWFYVTILTRSHSMSSPRRSWTD
jgi:hypothetical protein